MNTTAHYYVLLDRSGSMESIRTDVIDGFNELIAEQQADGPDARFTVVQFDTVNSGEVLVDAVPVAELVPLAEESYVPRAGTPLFDATGRLVGKAKRRERRRAAAGQEAEDITVVTITDGCENSSREYRRRDVLQLIEEREGAGWTFAFLSADLDAYADAAAMGYDHRSVRDWVADGAGTRSALANLSTAMTTQRGRRRRGEQHDHRAFFEEGDKAGRPGRSSPNRG